MEIGIPGLLHFFFKSNQFLQILMPKNSAPYSYKKDLQRLLIAYQNIALKLKQAGVSWIFEKTNTESILATKTPIHEVYVVVGPLTTMKDALEVQARLLSWIKLEQDSLFLTSCPVF